MFFFKWKYRYYIQKKYLASSFISFKKQDFWVVDRVNNDEDKFKNLIEYNFKDDELFSIY